MCSLANIAGTYEMQPSDRSLLVMPLFHVHGLMAGAPAEHPSLICQSVGDTACHVHVWNCIAWCHSGAVACCAPRAVPQASLVLGMHVPLCLCKCFRQSMQW